MQSVYWHQSRNVTVLLYHLVFPAKYRRAGIDRQVDGVLKEVCLEIAKRYQMKILEIGADKDHVHFLVQSVPTYSVTRLVRVVKSLTAKEVLDRCPQVKKMLWGGEFWTDGYYASSVGQHGTEELISKYVKEQGGDLYSLNQDDGAPSGFRHRLMFCFRGQWMERGTLERPMRLSPSPG